MAGAAGAYAASTGTIYLNKDWLNNASAAAVQAVLTEELGHHFDQLLSRHDTEGDEGKIFANLLVNPTLNFVDIHDHTEARSDHIKILVKDKWIRAEAAIFIGNNGPDTFTGTAGSDTIKGGGGADTLDGQGGNDRILGEKGKDSIHGGLGNDLIYGQDDADTLWGDSPDDTVNGGNDTIHGNQGADNIYGGVGNDSISGGDKSSNRLYGGNGNDLIQSFGFNSPDVNKYNSIFVSEMLLKNFLAFRQFKPSFAHQNEHLETYEKSVNEVFSLISNLKDEDLLNIPEAHSGFYRLTKE